MVSLWCVLSAVATAYLFQHQRRSIIDTLQNQSISAHRLISQRADQHDAHLTNLSALAQAINESNKELFYQVSGAIQTFYPRIRNIDFVPLTETSIRISTRSIDGEMLAVEQAILSAVRDSTGQLLTKRSPSSTNRYLLIKRSPNTDQATYGIALEIDASLLIENDLAYWRIPSTRIELALPDGDSLTELKVDSVEEVSSGKLIEYQSVLGSRSQPFLLNTSINLNQEQWRPIREVVVICVVIAMVLIGVFLSMRSAAMVRSAERRAFLGEQEARIAHASRVNALGEMASGLAHEITQPLTAILSQSQAGLRLLKMKSTPFNEVEKTLEAIVAQSKRAADIISRLRNWTRKSTDTYSIQNINVCVRNVYVLLEPEARKMGITLTIDQDKSELNVLGDSVEIEQVVFNLVKNAMESIEYSVPPVQAPAIQIYTTSDDKQVTVRVIDNGPGISTEVERNLYEPFITDKPDGIGLGLSLCQRIVERMEGQIMLANNRHAGATATVRFPVLGI